METKSDFEMQIVSALFRALPTIRQGRWIPSPLKEVDVLVHRTNGGVIAVEVTRLHPSGGEDLRRWEGAQSNIIEQARELYEREGFPGVEVVIFWSAWTNPERRQRLSAEALARFIMQNLPPQGEVVGFDSARDEDVLLPPAIDSIEIRRFFDGPNLWHAPHSGFVPDITPEMVEERLAAKNSKPPRYTGAYAEHWLALAVGFERRSTVGAVPGSLLEQPFRSSFHRVFIVTPPDNAVELTVTYAV